MKRAIILAAALVALAPAVQAQLYKYVDKDGKTVYSDQPPADVESKQIHVPHSRAPSPAAGAKSAVERDKELDKSRKEVAEKQKKAEEAEKRAAQVARRCQQLREAHQLYVDGGRIQKYDDKGERVLLSDDEIAAERERTRREMEEACKT